MLTRVLGAGRLADNNFFKEESMMKEMAMEEARSQAMEEEKMMKENEMANRENLADKNGSDVSINTNTNLLDEGVSKINGKLLTDIFFALKSKEISFKDVGDYLHKYDYQTFTLDNPYRSELEFHIQEGCGLYSEFCKILNDISDFKDEISDDSEQEFYYKEFLVFGFDNDKEFKYKIIFSRYISSKLNPDMACLSIRKYLELENDLLDLRALLDLKYLTIDDGKIYEGHFDEFNECGEEERTMS
jgi:hypothetical protein